MPFVDKMRRDTHFERHGREFGASTPAEYEALADAFMHGAMDQQTRECNRPNGRDRLRFRDTDRAFGCARTASMIIRTFYLVARNVIANHGGTVQYFQAECQRTSL